MELFNKIKSGSDEFARVIDWSPAWDTGAPMPQVFSNGHKVYLIYLIHEPDPNWDGTYVTMINPTSKTRYPLALVEFSGYTFRFGIANDEVFSGLPLWNKGLKRIRLTSLKTQPGLMNSKILIKFTRTTMKTDGKTVSTSCCYSTMKYLK